MQIRRAVHGTSTVAIGRDATAPAGRSWIPGALAVLIAILIAGGAFLYGDQPVIADARGYYDYGRLIATAGPKAFASDLRTYGYPAFLAGLMRVVGQDVEDVRTAAFLVQLGLLIGAAWFGARRLEGALGVAGLGPVMFVLTVANPFLLLYTVQLLTDLPSAVLVYLAVVLSLPQRRPEGAGRVTLLAAGALLCAGLAVMVRPSSLVVAPAIVAIWIARAILYRDVPWRALPAALLAFGLPFVPQVWSNLRAFGVPSPLVVNNLYGTQLTWGLMYLKYATLDIPGVVSSMYYENPFRPPPELTPGEVLRAHPGTYLAVIAIHAFALMDQDFPFAFIRAVDPWYRWPLAALNAVCYLGVLVGAVLGLRGADLEPFDLLRRRRFTVLALCLAALAVVAVYLPTAVESRFSLPLHLLLAPLLALAVVRLAAALPSAGVLRVSLGVLIVAVWVGLAASASAWLQNQAPLLVGLRGGRTEQLAEARQPASGASQPPPAPAAPTQPPPEIPSARYDADLPRELTISSGAEFDVTVTNTGQETWNVRGAYPVNIAARFIAQRTELHERVKGLMKDSQAASLPGDVAPGASATVRLRVLAPPLPGRYTLLIHVTRIGVPDSATNIERAVRVVD